MDNNNYYSVTTIVVTYNRLECLKKCINCLKKQTYKNNTIVIIDNASTDGTEAYCRNLEGIRYERLEENKGGSYGFYYGVKYAAELKKDLVWGMDDDAYPNEDALSKLVDVYKTGLSIETTALWSNSHSHKETYTPGLVEDIKKWTFVGFMLSKKMIDVIGYPRNDLFIFYDDAEYAKRIKKHGYLLKKVHDSIIIHEGAINKANNEQYNQKSFFGFIIKIQNLPAWKWYYMTRNIILIQDSYLMKILAVGLGLRNGIKIFILQPKLLKIWSRAIWHGIIGKSGKVYLP